MYNFVDNYDKIEGMEYFAIFFGYLLGLFSKDFYESIKQWWIKLRCPYEPYNGPVWGYTVRVLKEDLKWHQKRFKYRYLNTKIKDGESACFFDKKHL